jgi:hypothetical protein
MPRLGRPRPDGRTPAVVWELAEVEELQAGPGRRVIRRRELVWIVLCALTLAVTFAALVPTLVKGGQALFLFLLQFFLPSA